MINRQAIAQWRTNAPWNKSEQVEQDLIICRALVAIFSDEFLASELAFRGGTIAIAGIRLWETYQYVNLTRNI